ncbi:hypothetical protein CcaverHIS631_0112800 [Cutaneotrichosporon cavernicola]|nr:hypothetical protein CcaverHIS631_0112800 [Cutaneotrichosporon cavernicola]BEJ04102.1 hypothetical protein CcaverHIS641_0112770 [Cutaneotrichosporon cavernicola]
MGGGDLNMKKSWHPALLVNQDKVWQAEKKASEERKALRQLQKERDEERQLAELQRLQEAQTGKKRVEKLDWMYAAPSSSGMGGGRTERELEDYLLGKKRVDEALRGADKDVGNTSKDFIIAQNANTARDTAAKIREDPMLAMKKAEQARLAALMNRPDIRRALKAKQGEGKEEKRERRRAEKEERRRERHERRSGYSDEERERRHRRDRDDRDDRNDRRRDRDRDYDDRKRDRYDESERRRDRRDDRDDRDRRRNSRSVSPRRDDRETKRRDSRSDLPRRDRGRDRDDTPKREPRSPRDRSPVKPERDMSPKRERSPRERNGGNRDLRNGANGNGDTRYNGRRDERNGGPHNLNNGARDLRNGRNDRNDSRDLRNGNGRAYDHAPPRHPSPERKPAGNALDDMRAARLAAMTGAANQMSAERSTKLAQRADEEKRVFEAEERARAKYHRDEAAGMFMKHQEQLGGSVGLAENLQRRGGKGLLRDI